MPARISLRDARLERMRGKFDEQLIAPKPKEPDQQPSKPAAEVPVSTNVVVDTAPIAQAMTVQTQMLSAAMVSLGTERVVPAASPRKWNFRITERDMKGNIVAFTAEAAE